MLSFSAYWLQGLPIVIVPQPFFTQSNVTRHENKFCLIATVFLDGATVFFSSTKKETPPTEVPEECKQVVNKVTDENVEFFP